MQHEWSCGTEEVKGAFSGPRDDYTASWCDHRAVLTAVDYQGAFDGAQHDCGTSTPVQRYASVIEHNKLGALWLVLLLPL